MKSMLLVEGRSVKVIGNNTVNINEYVDFDISDLDIKELVSLSVIKDILNKFDSEDDIKEEIKTRINDLVPKHIVIDDIIASISYNH